MIYPGKTTKVDSFRIGHIGHIFPPDCERLVKVVSTLVKDMDLKLK